MRSSILLRPLITFGLGIACLVQAVACQSANAGIKMFPRDSLAVDTLLIPYHTTRSLVPRAKPYLEERSAEPELDLPKPGEPIYLLYGEDLSKLPGVSSPMVTNVTFTPAPKRVLLLLESFLEGVGHNRQNGVLKEVDCTSFHGNIGLVFDETQQEKKATFNAWLSEVIRDNELVVITSDGMKGCGNKERKPFRVHDTVLNDIGTTLNVTPLSWQDVAARVSVEFGTVKSELRRRSLVTRSPQNNDKDEDGVEEEAVIPISLQFGDRAQVYPNALTSIDIGLPFELPDFSSETTGRPVPTVTNPNLNVTCLKCGLTGEIKFHGKFDMDIFPEQRLESGFIELTLTKDLVARLELEFKTSGSFVFEFEYSLLPQIGRGKGIPVAAFGIPWVLEVKPYFDYSVGLSIEAGVPQLTATSGGEIRVPKGAIVRWDIANKTASTQKGWDVTVNKFPINVSQLNDTSMFSLGLNISSLPSLFLNLELIGGVGAQAGGKLGLILPRLYTIATLNKKVTEKCTFLGPDEYQYWPYGIALEQGLHTALYGELYAEVGIEALNLGKGVSVEQTFLSRDFPFANACFLFGSSSSGLGSLRNITEAKGEQRLDVEKVKQKWAETKKIPENVNLDLLKQEKDLPPDLRKELEGTSKENNNGTTKDVNNDDSKGSGSTLKPLGWTAAIVAFGAAFF